MNESVKKNQFRRQVLRAAVALKKTNLSVDEIIVAYILVLYISKRKACAIFWLWVLDFIKKIINSLKNIFLSS